MNDDLRRDPGDEIPPADAPPGYHNLRVVTEGGVSLPLVIGVDRLAQRPLAATAEGLPVALHGALTGSTVAKTSFPGKAGQKVMVEVEAQRLGSKLRPVIHLYDRKNRQLAWAWSSPALAGDTRLEATLPEAGSYTVTLTATNAGGSDTTTKTNYITVEAPAPGGGGGSQTFTASGDANVPLSTQPYPRQPSHEIFRPPYLFKGARPVVSGLSKTTVTWNEKFTVTTPNAGQITSNDQRYERAARGPSSVRQ